MRSRFSMRPPMMTACHLAAQLRMPVRDVLDALACDTRHGFAPPPAYAGASVWYLAIDLHAWQAWIKALRADLEGREPIASTDPPTYYLEGLRS